MAARGILASLLAFLMTGCWVGNAFYTAKDASQPIAPGIYKIVAQYPADQKIEEAEMRVGPGAGSATVFDDGDKPTVLLLVRLSGVPDRYIAQQLIDKDDRSVPQAQYLLFEVRPRGFRMSVPMCEKTARTVSALKVKVTGDTVKICTFSDAPTLETAMKVYAKNPDNWIELKRIRD